MSWKGISLIPAVLLLAACEAQRGIPAPSKPDTQSTETAASKSTSASAEKWQRMKDCAEQTERILKLEHLQVGKIDDEFSVTGSLNHYSPKYERCFVQVFFLHRSRDRNADAKAGIPITSWTLYDAFEGRELTTCTNNRVERRKQLLFCCWSRSR